MPRVVPSQVVEFIAQVFPWATRQDADQVAPLDGGSAAPLAGLVELVARIPEELLVLDGPDYSAVVAGVAAIRSALAMWHARNSNWPLGAVPGFPPVSPVTLIHRALVKCPDAVPAPTTNELAFIHDPEL